MFTPAARPSHIRSLTWRTDSRARTPSGSSRKNLFSFIASQQVEAEIAPLEDELRGWEAGATVGAAAGDLPLRRVPAAIARAENRGERLEGASPYVVERIVQTAARAGISASIDKVVVNP